jgi:hypothetical protein
MLLLMGKKKATREYLFIRGCLEGKRAYLLRRQARISAHFSEGKRAYLLTAQYVYLERVSGRIYLIDQTIKPLDRDNSIMHVCFISG